MNLPRSPGRAETVVREFLQRLLFQIYLYYGSSLLVALSAMEKLSHLLSKAVLSTALLILLQNPTQQFSPLSGFFHSFPSLDFFFSVNLQTCKSSKTKQERFFLIFSFTKLLFFCFFPSFDTEIFHVIDSLTNLTSLPISVSHHLSFLVTSSLTCLPVSRFCLHCCDENART